MEKILISIFFEIRYCWNIENFLFFFKISCLFFLSLVIKTRRKINKLNIFVIIACRLEELVAENWKDRILNKYLSAPTIQDTKDPRPNNDDFLIASCTYFNASGYIINLSISELKSEFTKTSFYARNTNFVVLPIL